MKVSPKNRLQQAFKEIVENMNVDGLEETIARYMSPHYVQHVDGQMLDYAGFVAHMKAQKAHLSSVHVIFDHIVAEDNAISTVHRAKCVKKDGTELIAKVIAYFELDATGKIIFADEFTKILKGSHQDHNIASMR